MTPDELKVLRGGATALQRGNVELGMPLGALIHVCLAEHESLPSSVTEALRTLADRMWPEWPRNLDGS